MTNQIRWFKLRVATSHCANRTYVCLSLVFLYDMFDDAFVIMNFSIVRAREFLASRCGNQRLNLVQFHREHLMLLSHLLAKNLNLVKSLFQLSLEVSISFLQAIKTVMVRIISLHENATLFTFNLYLWAFCIVMVLPFSSHKRCSTACRAGNRDPSAFRIKMMWELAVSDGSFFLVAFLIRTAF